MSAPKIEKTCAAALLDVGLKGAVVYRRKDGAAWTVMAAFDVASAAERYAAKASRNDDSEWPWEYAFVDLEEVA